MPIELGFILQRLPPWPTRTRPCATASPGRPPTTDYRCWRRHHQALPRDDSDVKVLIADPAGLRADGRPLRAAAHAFVHSQHPPSDGLPRCGYPPMIDLLRTWSQRSPATSPPRHRDFMRPSPRRSTTSPRAGHRQLQRPALRADSTAARHLPAERTTSTTARQAGAIWPLPVHPGRRQLQRRPPMLVRRARAGAAAACCTTTPARSTTSPSALKPLLQLKHSTRPPAERRQLAAAPRSPLVVYPSL